LRCEIPLFACGSIGMTNRCHLFPSSQAPAWEFIEILKQEMNCDV